jgi:methyl-accepting chemotaxis protein
MNFNRMSFKAKLLALCISLNLVSIAMGVVAYNGLHKVGVLYQDVTGRVMNNLDYTNQMNAAFKEVRVNLRSLGLPGLTAEQNADYVRKVEASVAEYDNVAKKYSEIPFVPGEKEVYEELSKNWLTFRAIGLRVLELNKSNLASDKEKMMHVFLVDCPSEAKKFEKAFATFKAFHVNNAKESDTAAGSASSQATFTLFAFILLGTVGGLFLGFLVSTKVSQQITNVVKLLTDSANQVTTATHQIAGASKSLLESTTEQASSLEETAASLEEVGSMVRKTTDNAKLSATRSEDSKKRAEDGQKVVLDMIGSMKDISKSNEELGEVVQVILTIEDKTKVINDIVFQTKLLSFNASVEAARAGVHGKGFAVVAEEIGKLAEMSGTASKEISAMLTSSISKVEALVDSTKTKVQSGVVIAGNCGEVLGDIVNNVTSVAGLVLDISSASEEQARGVAEINKAMAQLDGVTQRNAASSEESARAATHLSGQAETLKDAVGALAEVLSGSGRDPGKPIVALVPPADIDERFAA